MRMVCRCIQQLRQETPFSSIFVNLNKMLSNNDEYRKAVEIIARRKKMDQYEDFIDFFHCELFPEWKSECFNYYDGKAVIFKDHPSSTKEVIEKKDAFLCLCLASAKLIADKHPRIPFWNDFRWLCLFILNGNDFSLPVVQSTKHLVD